MSKKVIIITGANGGTGKEACKHFEEIGYKTIGLDINFDGDEKYECHTVDLKNENEVMNVVSSIVEKYKKIDCLYNIVGGSGRKYGDGTVDSCTLEGFYGTIDLNLLTQFLVCKYVSKQMIKQKSGCIINTASVLGMRGGGDMFATHIYAATKAGIIGMSRAMASCYAKYNVRVNVIAPGLIETPMSKRAQSDEMILNYMDYKQPIYASKHTLGKPKSLVKAAEFLCSDESDFVTGIVLPVDGGWSSI